LNEILYCTEFLKDGGLIVGLRSIILFIKSALHLTQRFYYKYYRLSPLTQPTPFSKCPWEGDGVPKY